MKGEEKEKELNLVMKEVVLLEEGKGRKGKKGKEVVIIIVSVCDDGEFLFIEKDGKSESSSIESCTYQQQGLF